MKLETESLTAVEYSCIVNGQILRVHPMSLKSPPTEKKKSTQCPLGWLEKGLNRNHQRVDIISLLGDYDFRLWYSRQ
jgi:hypothetical protein